MFDTDSLHLIAACAFGLEFLVKQELLDLGFDVDKVSDGRVHFTGDIEAVVQTNLWLRTADRIGIELASFEARSFDELFDQTQALPWEDWLPRDAFMHITARSNKSKLYSLRDIQKIAKKAVIEAMRRRYKQQTFGEDGARFPIDVAILNDRVSLILDTTGPSLHKRGYRSDAGEAPLKETLAAALVMLSRWDPSRTLADPLCGSGTILIEAALQATHRAPGLRREFQAQAWPWMPKELWFKNRQQAKSLIQPADFRLLGSDIDARVLAKARENAQNAGVADLVSFQALPVSQFRSRKRYGVWISNPPYGLRLSERKELNVLYEEIKDAWSELNDWSYFLLSPDTELEQRLGRPASKRRKLFNGQIACQYFQFFGPRPPLP